MSSQNNAKRSAWRPTRLEPPELAETLLNRVLPEADVKPLISELPEGVEVTLCSNDRVSLLFLQNTTAEWRSVPNVPDGMGLLTEAVVKNGKLRLERFGCMVVKLK